MSDKKFISMGAECVAGDLILDRITVGSYRNGQFVLSEAGAKMEVNVIDVQAVEVKPAKRAKAVKEVVVETPVDDEDPLAGLDAELAAG